MVFDVAFAYIFVNEVMPAWYKALRKAIPTAKGNRMKNLINVFYFKFIQPKIILTA
jgi:hypothetical protein